QEAAHYHHNNPAHGEQRFPRKKVLGYHTAVISDTVSGQLRGKFSAYFYRLRICQQLPGYNTAQQYASHKKQVPYFLFPVVAEKRDLSGNTSGTDMPQRRGNAESFIAKQQQSRNGQANKRAGYVPGPGLFKPFKHIQ